jgi:hypothetical protein
VTDETGMKAPISFTTMHMHAAPQDAGLLQCGGPGLQGVSSSIGPVLCTILQVDLAEFTFHALG